MLQIVFYFLCKFLNQTTNILWEFLITNGCIVSLFSYSGFFKTDYIWGWYTFMDKPLAIWAYKKCVYRLSIRNFWQINQRLTIRDSLQIYAREEMLHKSIESVSAAALLFRDLKYLVGTFCLDDSLTSGSIVQVILHITTATRFEFQAIQIVWKLCSFV